MNTRQIDFETATAKICEAEELEALARRKRREADEIIQRALGFPAVVVHRRSGEPSILTN